MPYCKNDPKKTYKGNEPSPKGLGYCAHSEKVGKIREGLDKNKWIVIKTSKGIHKWIKYTIDKNIKKYYIYDEDQLTKKYLIKIKNNYDIYIYDFDDNKLVSHFITKKMFIASKYSILFEVKKNKYIIITENGIKKFNTNNDDIIKYYSLPPHHLYYNIAIGNKYIYFFGYPDGYLPIEYLPKIKNKKNLNKVFDEARKLQPFLISVYSHKPKNNLITLEEFREIQKQPLDDISLKKIKELAQIFGVTTSGNKKKLVDRIYRLRDVIVYNNN